MLDLALQLGLGWLVERPARRLTGRAACQNSSHRWLHSDCPLLMLCVRTWLGPGYFIDVYANNLVFCYGTCDLGVVVV